MAATATRAQAIHYVITIAGIYYTQGQKGENTFNYSIDVPMSQEQLDDPKVSALSLFRHNYADKMMKQKYPDYEGLATHEITKVQCSDAHRLEDNISLMSRLQLERYIKTRKLPVTVELYEDAGSLRAAITEYRKDEDGFLKTQKIAEKRKGPEIKRQSAADKMIELYGSAASLKPLKVELEGDDLQDV